MCSPPRMLSRCSSTTQAEAPAPESPKPKSPSLLAKLLAPFKSEKPKTEKKVKEKPAKKVEKKEEVRFHLDVVGVSTDDVMPRLLPRHPRRRQLLPLKRPLLQRLPPLRSLLLLSPLRRRK